MGDPIRVAIVDDDERCRQAVRGWFDGVGDVLIVGDAPGGEEMLRRLRELRPDVVLIDVGAAETERVRQIAACAGVIVLHFAGQEASVLEALRAGALGHLVKGQAQPNEVIRAIYIVSRGEAVLGPGMVGHVLDEVIQNLRGAHSVRYPIRWGGTRYSKSKRGGAKWKTNGQSWAASWRCSCWRWPWA